MFISFRFAVDAEHMWGLLLGLRKQKQREAVVKTTFVLILFVNPFVDQTH